MEIITKPFERLTNDELLEIFKLRVSVFVVEQCCPYQEIDDYDRSSVHMYISDGDGILAYLRVIPKGVIDQNVHIGRVISVKRRCGLGTQILKEGIRYAKEKLQAEEIEVEAQVYARKLYENCGFVQVSEEFLIDGLPHIRMILD